jgi:2-dehydro-3-deoxyphosphogluconate aldolase / (4S)-4-hydroxy-2-oxoglutarate aldolase
MKTIAKEEIIQRIKSCGVVAVVRAQDAEQAVRIAEACRVGGIAAIEITFTVPFAHQVIEHLAQAYPGGEILIGAGTVLDPETARIAILSGARFVVSPCLNHETMKLCNRYRVPCMPGAMTVQEAVQCLEAGADLIKVFPGELFGPAILKAMKGPLPQADFMPTGGVDLGNLKDWVKVGASAVGVGGNLTAGAKTGDYASIAIKAREFVERICEARSSQQGTDDKERKGATR